MRGMWIALIAAAMVASMGCSSNEGPDCVLAVDCPIGMVCLSGTCRPGSRDAGADAALPDAGSDSGSDSGTDAAIDVGFDAPIDAGADARTADAGVDASLDAMPDAMDAGAADVGVDAMDAGAVIEIATAPDGPPESSGSALTDNFWPGWRFEVPAPGLDVEEVGFVGDKSGVGPIFAALVRLTGPSDVPDSANLESADRIAFTAFDPGTVPASAPEVISARLSARLDPGWYAVVFGSGSDTFGSPPSARGGVRTVTSTRSPGAQLTFTLRQSDGMFILQGGTRRIFVRGIAR